MSDPLLIYGATGYTGRLLVERARAVGLRPVLGGRDAGRVRELAHRFGLEPRACALTDAAALGDVLRGIRVVLHAAGPFSETATPMVDACLRAGAHYMDIAAELEQIEGLARRDGDGRARGIMILPGAGFDVVASDCLAAYVARRLPDASRLAIGLAGWAFASRGSAKTMLRHLTGRIQVRRDHRIVDVFAGTLERGFDYGRGRQASSAVSWGDVAAAYYTTGIPNITTYFESTPAVRAALSASRALGPWLTIPPAQAWLVWQTALLPPGPSDEQRASRRMTIVAEVENEAGRRSAARLCTPEAYTLTAHTAVAIAARILDGDLEPGFQTPARVYGEDLILGFEGVSREDLAA